MGMNEPIFSSLCLLSDGNRQFLATIDSEASPLIPKDPFVLIWNDPWDAQLLSWQI
jgi:hypothetical protein